MTYPGKEKEEKFFEKKIQMIERYNTSSYVEIYDNRYRHLQFLKYAPLLSKMNWQNGLLLDFGAGTGLFLDYLIEKGHQDSSNITKEPPNRPVLVGLDIATNMLLEYRSKIKNLSNLSRRREKIPIVLEDIHLICADGEHLPLRGQQIHSVLSATSLQNLPYPQKGLDEIVRVSIKGATVGISYLKKKETQHDIQTLLEKSLIDVQIISSTVLNHTQENIQSEDYLFIARIP